MSWLMWFKGVVTCGDHGVNLRVFVLMFSGRVICLHNLMIDYVL